MNKPGQPIPMRGPRVIIRKPTPAPATGVGRRTKRILVWLAGLVTVALGAWLVASLLEPAPPNPETASSKEIASYLVSDKFEKLSDAKKDAYSERLRQLPEDRRRELFQVQGLTSQERRRLGGNMGRGFRREMMQEMKDFFKLSPEQQLAALDKRIAEMDARRRDMQARRPNPGGGARQSGTPGRPPRGPRRINADRMQQFMEQRLSNTTPEERAVMSEYWRRLRERRQQIQSARS